MTVGVVSALHRSVRTRGGQSLVDMIQTDAPIAAGSSGGALLDAAGKVIGVTTAVAVTDAGAEGFGFATPIEAAKSAAEQLMTTGKVVTVWLGVEGSDLDAATAQDRWPSTVARWSSGSRPTARPNGPDWRLAT